MTPDDVKRRVADIATMSGDPEAAHGAEDDLMISVLRDISRKSADPVSRKMARECLKTRMLDFTRWYA